MCHLAGWRLVHGEEGSATWTMPASPWFATGYGTFYGGAIALLADGVINTALTTTLPPGTSFGTLDLQVHLLRPVTPDGREMLARGTVVQRGRTIAVTTGEAATSCLAGSIPVRLRRREWPLTRGSRHRIGRQAAAGYGAGG